MRLEIQKLKLIEPDTEELQVPKVTFSSIINMPSSDFQKIIRDFGGIDLCIFSSGIYERSLEKEIDIENIKKTFEINYIGTVNCVKSSENYFKQQKKGHLELFGYKELMLE